VYTRKKLSNACEKRHKGPSRTSSGRTGSFSLSIHWTLCPFIVRQRFVARYKVKKYIEYNTVAISNIEEKNYTFLEVTRLFFDFKIGEPSPSSAVVTSVEAALSLLPLATALRLFAARVLLAGVEVDEPASASTTTESPGIGSMLSGLRLGLA
jgi:hypothetical protein